MKTTIRRITPGTLFEYGGVRWVKLDALEEGGALVLAADVLFNRAFDTENRNDWTCSTLREELGGAFADSLQEAGGNFNDFSLFRQYLTANDGMKRYGSTIDGIALLSCEQYRKYRDIIPQATERWWTITPYSCGEDYAAFVCAVKCDGSIDFDAACCNDWGVRPACVMEPDTMVEKTLLKRWRKAPQQAVSGSIANRQVRSQTEMKMRAVGAKEGANNIISVLGGMTLEEATNALHEALLRVTEMRIKNSRKYII